MKKTKMIVMLMIILFSITLIVTNVQAVTGDESAVDEQAEKTARETTTDDDTETGTETGTDLTWTDASKIKSKVEIDNLGGYSLIIEGLSADKTYYLYVSNGTAPNPTLTDGENPPEGFISTASQNTKLSVNNMGRYFELKGETYFTLVESQSANTKKYSKAIVSGKKIDRPELKSLGLRFKCVFAGSATTISFKDPVFNGTGNAGRKLKIKVGRVTDTNILRSIQKGEKNALTKLSEYAQKDTKPNFSGEHTMTDTAHQALSTNNWKLVNNAYYYAYIIADDENGKYFPVSDVSLYQAIITSDAALFDYLSDDFKWNLEDEGNNAGEEQKKPTEQKKDDTVMPGKTLPKTGQTIIMIVATIGIIAVAVVFARKAKKYNI